MLPLVRMLVRNGVSHGELNEVLKNVFVEVVDDDFALSSRRPSQSRIAILTGLSRKEVAKQQALLDNGVEIDFSSNLNRVIRVLEGWHTDSDFTGPYGMPIEIPFESKEGASFTELVRRHSGDMSARAMLDELLRVGTVESQPNGSLRVLTRAYIPQTLHPDALERFGEVVHNFVATIEFNMRKSAPGAGRFERIVFSDPGLPAHLLPAFDRVLREKGQQFLVELDNWLSSQDRSSHAEQENLNSIKTGVGVYHFIEED